MNIREYHGNVLRLIHKFLRHQKGAIAIEMAFIIPLFLGLIMATLDYAILFSLRVGIDKTFQEVTRIATTPSADFSTYRTPTITAIPTTGDKDLDAALALHRGLSDTVFDISQVRIMGVRRTWGGFDINTPLSTLCTFTAAPPTAGCQFVGGTTNEINRMQLRYRHTFFTPFGRLVSGGSPTSNRINLVSERYYGI